jgi:hypothetical protein
MDHLALALASDALAIFVEWVDAQLFLDRSWRLCI